MLVVGLTGLTGCKNCEDLIAKVCTDLGPDDCKYWKDHGWDEEMIPGCRGVNRACSTMMDDAVHGPLLKAQKDMVKAYREADAKKAGN